MIRDRLMSSWDLYWPASPYLYVGKIHGTVMEEPILVTACALFKDRGREGSHPESFKLGEELGPISTVYTRASATRNAPAVAFECMYFATWRHMHYPVTPDGASRALVCASYPWADHPGHCVHANGCVDRGSVHTVTCPYNLTATETNRVKVLLSDLGRGEAQGL